jgi:hypothetical protein
LGHAYYLNYQTADRLCRGIWNVVNWDEVANDLALNDSAHEKRGSSLRFYFDSAAPFCYYAAHRSIVFGISNEELLLDLKEVRCCT